MDDHADELSALLSAEQGVTLAEARWEINLLIKAFGPVLMQMELHEKEQDVQPIKRSTKRYVPIDASGTVSPRNLPVILSFGKILPAFPIGGYAFVVAANPGVCSLCFFGVARESDSYCKTSSLTGAFA